MDNLPFTHTSKISPRSFVEDYLDNYTHHRSIVVSHLLKDWDSKSDSKRLILGSRVLIEYGACAEEFFAFTFAIIKTCNAYYEKSIKKQTDTSLEIDEVFYNHLFDYRHNELWAFVRRIDFRLGIEKHMRLPDSITMSRHMGLPDSEYNERLRKIGECIEYVKDAFFECKFQDIYNKLKHPFLVGAPIKRDDAGALVLPVLKRSPIDGICATITPVKMGLDYLETFQSDIQIVESALEFLLKLFLYKFQIQSLSG